MVKVLPRISGERLDLIVDFLTYVAVPAFAFSQSDLLPEAFRALPPQPIYGRPPDAKPKAA